MTLCGLTKVESMRFFIDPMPEALESQGFMGKKQENTSLEQALLQRIISTH